MADPTSEKKTILILGASYGGLSTAHQLLKHILPSLPNSSTYHVTIVSPSKQTMCRPACPRALISDDFFDQNKLFVDTSKQLEQYGSEKWTFINGKATNVDDKARIALVTESATGNEITIPFYALVIATGASTASPLLGLNTTETALTDAWKTFRIALPTAENIVVAGGGPTGVEVAGELGEYLNGRAGWFSPKIQTPKVHITLVTSSDRLLPGLRPAIAATAESYLHKVGVTIIKGAKVVAVEPEDAGTHIHNLTSPTTVQLSTGESLNADLFIPAVGTTPNTSFLPDRLLDSKTNRVVTHSGTFRITTPTPTSPPLLYAIGDCSTAFPPSIHNILAALPVLAATIKRDLHLSANPKSSCVPQEKVFEADTRETQLVPVGTKMGVGAVMGWRLPSWVVWVVKGRDYWVWTTGGLWGGGKW